ncbi:MAG: GNAT family protein [Candidatus Neomarinimicrobiota bacterium]|jgi:GNAT superfamily N-acetyltransferase|nr:GNAT family protein [Candidatus Neomarinimicrobiota bacterium]MDP7565904.1 GNAT family protein [Candidatus Neomarinimicrobiota bacterium]MEE1505865.1 GNAT family protein [Candidatus Neomarinimicrobiota bacterium]|tara:strand:+ start:658 stop:1260 length:603 start_codon:yes stop_codon:yes gene_type:complete
MEHNYSLRDGTELTIRNLSGDDFQLSYDFFMSIPEDRRKYFRSDVLDVRHIKERCQDTEKGEILRRIALMNNVIVGDTSLEVDTDSWKSGTAYLRLVIDPKQVGKGVQYVLAKDMYEIAQDKNLKKVVAKFMRPQIDLMDIYQKLGFRMEGVLPDYVHDQEGKEQDLVVMVASLDDMRKAYSFIGDWLDDEGTSLGPGEM